MALENDIARNLLQIKAIKLQPSEPFTWSSGWKSPIYCDNRKSLGYPKIRTFIRQSLAKLIEERFGKPDLIAGVATAAIAPGVLVAEALGLPFCYVRSTPKDHGLKKQIEGDYAATQSCVVIVDLISTQALITSYPKLNLNAVNEYGESALYIACKRDQNTVAEYLLNKSEVNKNAATILGNSPMLIAAWRDNNEIARKLIENGADFNARTNANRQYHGGVFALDVAKERGNQMLVDLLKPLVENNLSHQPKP